jgi:hypothetical protein
MAHPKRKRFVDELVPRLDAEPEVVWDRRGDRWETGRRSLLAFDRSATHHLVVQDDALVSRDLVAGTAQAVADVGERPVCLYVGVGRPYRAQVQQAHLAAKENNAAWMVMPGPWWGVAIVVPTSHIPDLVKWCDQRPDVPNYDKRISRWYQQQNISCWYSMPSLVDHRRVDENPSLVAGRTGDRYAHWFIGEDASALDVKFGADKALEVSAAPLSGAARRALNQRLLREQREASRARRVELREERRQAALERRQEAKRRGSTRRRAASSGSEPEPEPESGWRQRAEKQSRTGRDPYS